MYKRAAPWIITLLSLAVVCGGAGAALVVRADNGPVERTVALSSMPPWQTALDGRAGRLYITGFVAGGTGGRVVSVVDTTTGRLVATVAADNSPDVQPLLDTRTHHLFLFGGSGGAVLDTTSERVAATVPVGADAAALDAADNHLFVTDRVKDRVGMIDTRSMALLKTTPVGHDPAVVALDETTHRVFVFNALDATISVLDARDGRVLHTTDISAGGSAPVVINGLTVDEATARVFIVDSDSGVMTTLDATSGAGRSSARRAMCRRPSWTRHRRQHDQQQRERARRDDWAAVAYDARRQGPACPGDRPPDGACVRRQLQRWDREHAG